MHGPFFIPHKAACSEIFPLYLCMWEGFFHYGLGDDASWDSAGLQK